MTAVKLKFEFEFDPITQRYRVISGANKGRFISDTAVRSLTERYIADRKEAIRYLTESMLAKRISVGQWEKRVGKLLREAHIASYMLGVGGLRFMTKEDYRRVTVIIREEFDYLRGFAIAILAGALTAAQILSRMALYLESLRKTFEIGRTISHRRNGYLWERNRLRPAEHCQECIQETGKGWVEIGSLIPIGRRECAVNDRCYKEYSRNAKQPKNSLLLSTDGWLGSPQSLILVDSL